MITWISENWNNILAVYGAIVALATAVVKLTPSKKDDSVWGNIIKILDFFSTAFADSDARKLKSNK